MTRPLKFRPLRRRDNQAPSRATIVFLDHTAKWSGGEISLFNLVTHLDTTRFRPVVVLFEDGELRFRLDAAGIKTRVLTLDKTINRTRKDAIGTRQLFSLRGVGVVFRFLRRLRQILRAEGAAIAHCNSLKSDILGGIAARWAGVPAIWHIRDRIADDYLPAKTARAFCFLARLIPTQIIAVSRATLEALQLPRAHLKSGRARTIHNGTRLEDFAPAPRPAFLSGRIVIGLVGRLAPWKGQHVFLEAAALVRREFPDTRFQIIGAALFETDDSSQNHEAKLRAQCRDLGLENAVEWLGFRADVPQLMLRMDVLAHASITGEPFGQVIIEGMAAGRPVVATDGGGVPEIVIDGETGILIPMGDATAMANALLKLCRNPQLAREMGAAGRARAFRKFGIEATATRVQAVYDEMLGR